MEELTLHYTFLFGTRDAAKHIAKNMLSLMTQHPEYTSDELFIELLTRSFTLPVESL